MSSERPVILPIRRIERAVGGRSRLRARWPLQVAGAVADQRHRLLGQRGEHQFAHAAVGQRFAGRGIDDLGKEMILPEHRAILGLGALAGDAGPDHLGQPIEVDGIDAERALDFRAHRLGPRFGAVHADAQCRVLRVDALAAQFVGDVEHVRWRDQDDRRLEVADQLHLLLGLPARHRDDRAAEPLGPVMRAEAAGEQAVAIGDVGDVPLAAAAGVDRTGHQLAPPVDVGLRVADHRRLAGRPARGVDAHHFLARHGEHPVRVVVAQVLLVGEREAREIGERAEIVRMNAGGVEGGAVVRHVAVDVVQRPLEALGLQRDDLVATGGFDGV